MNRKALFLILFLSVGAHASAHAKNTPAPSVAVPSGALEITAEQSLEWYEEQKLYVARGMAKATRGDMTIEADILTAHQKEATLPASAKTDTKPETSPETSIDRVAADGNVHIKTSQQEMFGTKAVYDLTQGIAQLTGDNLKYKAPDYTVTAKDSFDYYENNNQAVARGKAVAIDAKNPADKRRIEGNTLSARFETMPNGKKELAELTADGQVTVVSKGDISRGDNAVYDVKRDIAVLKGNVRITRDTMQLAGDAAEVDFKTGKSRLLNEGTGRVRAIMLSTENKKTDTL